jgi:hypothetical protein
MARSKPSLNLRKFAQSGHPAHLLVTLWSSVSVTCESGPKEEENKKICFYFNLDMKIKCIIFMNKFTKTTLHYILHKNIIEKSMFVLVHMKFSSS